MRWPPYYYIFFDCDSTLTAVEGIDILAEAADKKEAIEELTNAAMNGEVDLDSVYAQRLQTINPTHRDVKRIRDRYKKHVVPDAADVIGALQALGRKVFIISGGLYEPVKEFGLWLGVPEANIRAVELKYDSLAGDWWRSDGRAANERYAGYQTGALTVSDGKAEIVNNFLSRESTRKGQYRSRSLLIGDGNSDLLASDSVDLFVGYGGVVERPKVKEDAAVFIHSQSLAPLLALIVGPAGLTQLANSKFDHLIEKALSAFQTGDLTFKDEQLKQKFQEAYQTVSSRPD